MPARSETLKLVLLFSLFNTFAIYDTEAEESSPRVVLKDQLFVRIEDKKYFESDIKQYISAIKEFNCLRPSSVYSYITNRMQASKIDDSEIVILSLKLMQFYDVKKKSMQNIESDGVNCQLDPKIRFNTHQLIELNQILEKKYLSINSNAKQGIQDIFNNEILPAIKMVSGQIKHENYRHP